MQLLHCTSSESCRRDVEEGETIPIPVVSGHGIFFEGESSSRSKKTFTRRQTVVPWSHMTWKASYWGQRRLLDEVLDIHKATEGSGSDMQEEEMEYRAQKDKEGKERR